jgi:ABC-type Fe3+-hydroxamate transport system substrate-binding protein
MTAARADRIRSSARAAARAAVFIFAWILAGCREQQGLATTKDDLGREVAVPRRVARIVTLAPNLTELAFAAGAGERVVGVDDASNFPPETRTLPRVGAMQPNVEKIAALRPDLVLASTEGNHPNLVPALAAAHIPLFVVKTDRLAEVTKALRRLGEVLGAPRAAVAARELDEAIASERRKRSHPPRILFAVWTDPLYVAGTSTFTHDLFMLAGAQNAVQVEGWPQYSLEALVASPPDLILYPRGAVTPEQMAALLARVPSLHAKVVAVDEDIFQRPGPRVARAAKALNSILDWVYPPETP